MTAFPSGKRSQSGERKPRDVIGQPLYRTESFLPAGRDVLRLLMAIEMLGAWSGGQVPARGSGSDAVHSLHCLPFIDCRRDENQ